jgi:hypothetical protein
LSFNFEHNSRLESIGFQSFEASSIQSIDVPKSVKNIGKYAFSLSKLSSVNISNPSIEIADSAFLNTNSLQDINISENHNPNLADYGFNAKQRNKTNLIPSAETTIIKATPIFSTEFNLDAAIQTGFNTKTEITLDD